VTGEFGGLKRVSGGRITFGVKQVLMEKFTWIRLSGKSIKTGPVNSYED
jgi:hypothetical protein